MLPTVSVCLVLLAGLPAHIVAAPLAQFPQGTVGPALEQSRDAVMPQNPAASRPSPAAGLLSRMQEALAKGERRRALQLATEAARILESTDPASPAFSQEVQAVAGLYRQFGFGLRAEQFLDTAIRRSSSANGNKRDLLLQRMTFYRQNRQYPLALLADQELLTAISRSGQSDSDARIRILHQLSELAESAGQFERAEKYLRQLSESMPPGSAPVVLIDFLNRHGRIAEARALATAAAEAPLPSGAPLAVRIQSRNVYISQLEREKRWREAIELRRTLIEELAPGAKTEDFPNVFSMYENLANALTQSGDIPGASRVWVEAQALAEASLSKEGTLQYRLQYAHWLNNSAQKPDAAEAIFLTLLESPNLQSYQQVQILESLAAIQGSRRNYEDAEEFRAKAREIGAEASPRQSAPTLSPEFAKLERALASSNWDEMDHLIDGILSRAPEAIDSETIPYSVFAAARFMHQQAPERADAIMARLLSATDRFASWWPAPQQIALMLATHYSLDCRDPASARAILKRLRTVIDETLGPHSVVMTQALQAAVRLEQSSQDLVAALRASEDSLAHIESTRGPSSRDTLQAILLAANSAFAAGATARSLVLLERASPIIDKAIPAPDPGRVYTRNEIAARLVSMGKFEEALPLAEEAVALCARFGHDAAPSRQQLDRILQARPSSPR